MFIAFSLICSFSLTRLVLRAAICLYGTLPATPRQRLRSTQHDPTSDRATAAASPPSNSTIVAVRTSYVSSKRPLAFCLSPPSTPTACLPSGFLTLINLPYQLRRVSCMCSPTSLAVAQRHPVAAVVCPHSPSLTRRAHCRCSLKCGRWPGPRTTRICTVSEVLSVTV